MMLKLGQAYRSMPELDGGLFFVLKGAQKIISCENLSIWLLDESSTELECTHVVGNYASIVLGDTMRAKKFTKACKKDFAKTPYNEWLDSKTLHSHFKLTPRKLAASPLTARGELLGVIIAVKKTAKTAFTRADHDTLNTLAREVAVAIQNTQLYEQQDMTNQHQQLLNQVSQHLHQTLDLDKLIPNIFAEVNKAIQAEAQSIWLVDEAEDVIRCSYATGPESDMLIGFAVSRSAKSIVGTSVARKESIIIRDAQKDPRRARAADEWTGFITRSLMTVPLVLKDQSIGAIQAVNKRGGRLFNQEDLDLFRAIADSAALAVHNAQLMAELQNSYDLTLDALSAALDLRDRETEGHSRRVVEYTARLAEEIGLDSESIKSIRRGALIHDIGKIGVPDAVLRKPGPLNDEERKVIELHPQAGHDMLVDIPYLKQEIRIVLGHQEKWDGTGYPFGLRGEEIPLGARLFMIADTYDALTSDRPYRKGCSYEAARKIIEGESGKQFDPQAVAAFLAIPPEEWNQIRQHVMDGIAQRLESKKQIEQMDMKLGEE
jgi:HD-GYP domain-containing protein (c-di-GMP phosphodiesterase class II)